MESKGVILKCSVLTVALFTASALCPASARAETVDFGGAPDSFKDGGDQEPPSCQADLPAAATQPFFVKWNCSDDVADAQELRSELWISRKGAPAAQLIGTFLGFPASVYIDQNMLHVANFADGLPVSFRLYVRDTAGNAAVSKALNVFTSDLSATTCSLTVNVAASAAAAATSADLTGAAVTTLRSSDTQLVIKTPNPTAAATCDIAALCSSNSELTLEADLTLAAAGGATGTLTVQPGGLAAAVTGTYQRSAGKMTGLTVSGAAHIDSSSANVTLTCR